MSARFGMPQIRSEIHRRPKSFADLWLSDLKMNGRKCHQERELIVPPDDAALALKIANSVALLLEGLGYRILDAVVPAPGGGEHDLPATASSASGQRVQTFPSQSITNNTNATCHAGCWPLALDAVAATPLNVSDRTSLDASHSASMAVRSAIFARPAALSPWRWEGDWRLEGDWLDVRDWKYTGGVCPSTLPPVHFHWKCFPDYPP